jgi:molecular chaperone GrpE
MSEASGRRGGPRDGDADEVEGGSLPPSRELEDALREAAESVEAHQKASRGETDPAPEVVAELEALRAELAEARDRHLRLAADFDNFRRRSLRDREEAHHFGHQNLVKELLSSVDNLERAIDHARKGGEGNTEGLLEGVELVLRELHAVLSKHGVTSIEALGQAFDPALHEAMAQVPDASVPVNTVVQVFQPGYQLRGRLLRPARVLVSKPPEGATAGAREGEDT